MGVIIIVGAPMGLGRRVARALALGPGALFCSVAIFATLCALGLLGLDSVMLRWESVVAASQRALAREFSLTRLGLTSLSYSLVEDSAWLHSLRVEARHAVHEGLARAFDPRQAQYLQIVGADCTVGYGSRTHGGLCRAVGSETWPGQVGASPSGSAISDPRAQVVRVEDRVFLTVVMPIPDAKPPQAAIAGIELSDAWARRALAGVDGGDLSASLVTAKPLSARPVLPRRFLFSISDVRSARGQVDDAVGVIPGGILGRMWSRGIWIGPQARRQAINILGILAVVAGGWAVIRLDYQRRRWMALLDEHRQSILATVTQHGTPIPDEQTVSLQPSMRDRDGGALLSSLAEHVSTAMRRSEGLLQASQSRLQAVEKELRLARAEVEDLQRLQAPFARFERLIQRVETEGSRVVLRAMPPDSLGAGAAAWHASFHALEALLALMRSWGEGVEARGAWRFLRSLSEMPGLAKGRSKLEEDLLSWNDLLTRLQGCLGGAAVDRQGLLRENQGLRQLVAHWTGEACALASAEELDESPRVSLSAVWPDITWRLGQPDILPAPWRMGVLDVDWSEDPVIPLPGALARDVLVHLVQSLAHVCIRAIGVDGEVEDAGNFALLFAVGPSRDPGGQQVDGIEVAVRPPAGWGNAGVFEEPAELAGVAFDAVRSLLAPLGLSLEGPELRVDHRAVQLRIIWRPSARLLPTHSQTTLIGSGDPGRPANDTDEPMA